MIRCKFIKKVFLASCKSTSSSGPLPETLEIEVLHNILVVPISALLCTAISDTAPVHVEFAEATFAVYRSQFHLSLGLL